MSWITIISGKRELKDSEKQCKGGIDDYSDYTLITLKIAKCNHALSLEPHGFIPIMITLLHYFIYINILYRYIGIYRERTIKLKLSVIM
ncbi:hypothetical protein PDA01_06390 [Pediococcus damnosus]|nr:hypothetical protein PDA01_06390 [Pediococcus damnosus]